MDKIIFLATLAGKLSGYQMPSDAVETSIAQVKGYIDRVSDEEFAADPATEEDIETIAKDIYNKYLAAEAEKAKEETAETATEETAEEPIEESEPEAELPVEISDTEEKADVSESISEDTAEAEEDIGETAVEQVFTFDDDDEPPAPEEIIEQLVVAEEYVQEAVPEASDEEFFEMLAKEAEGERNDLERIKELELKALAMANKDDPEMVAQVLSQDQKLVEMVAASDIADEFDPIEAVFDPAQRPDIALEEADLAEAFLEEDEEFASELMVDKEDLKKVDDDSPKKKKVKVKSPKEKVKGTPLFWTLFILTLPITMPLYLAVCVFFGILYVAVTALIVVFAGATVATVACGTALALVGIIYGSTQCFKSTAIGLFEIGVGIALGGVTMLVSVLLYNVAIRFVPRLYKLINRFGGWAFGGIGQLYTNIKKECGKKK